MGQDGATSIADLKYRYIPTDDSVFIKANSSLTGKLHFNSTFFYTYPGNFLLGYPVGGRGGDIIPMNDNCPAT